MHTLEYLTDTRNFLSHSVTRFKRNSQRICVDTFELNSRAHYPTSPEFVEEIINLVQILNQPYYTNIDRTKNVFLLLVRIYCVQLKYEVFAFRQYHRPAAAMNRKQEENICQPFVSEEWRRGAKWISRLS